MRKLKGFTLVEILIVIVIIGILIGALVPRMQSAQGRARDVARKNDLSQIQSAILTSFQDKGVYPCQYESGNAKGSYGCLSDSAASNGMDISSISNLLLAAGMNSVPSDPLRGNVVKGIGDSAGGEGQYRYVLTKSNKITDGGVVLMANTEIEGGSNRVVCDGNPGTETACPATDCVDACKGEDNTCDTSKKYLDGYEAGQGGITSDSDVRDISLCTSLTKTNACANDEAGNCTYQDETQLRYILMY